jgi:rhomboid protease GluP
MNGSEPRDSVPPQTRAAEDVAQDEVLSFSADMLAAEQSESDGRVDFEQRMSRLPRMTIMLIVLNAIAFGWAVAMMLGGNDVVQVNAMQRDPVMRGEVWRFLSATFMHANLGHLLGNCLVLYILGLGCEHAFGARRMVAIYFATGIAGWLLYIAFHTGPAVGASGAIFGLLGCLMTFFYRHRNRIAVRDRRIGLVLAIWAAYSMITGWFDPLIANFAHLGGFLAGAVAGLVTPTRLLDDATPTTHNSL